jgi:hypothetical protein
MTANVFKAGYLPGLNDTEITYQRLQLGTPQAPLWVDVPQLSVGQMTALATRVRHASQTQLKPMQVSEIVRVLDQATARLLDSHDPFRQQLDRLLPQATGFDPEMVRLNLTAYLQTFRGLQLQRFVAGDFANPNVLDEFQPRVQGGWTKAFGPDLLVHVWAGNVPALPMWSFVSGLLVKAGSLGKVASAEPVFATLYARLLAEVEPRWRDCFAVLWWPSDHNAIPVDTATERTAFGLADVVVAYGGNDALQAMQAHVPVTTRFLPHGHKLSFGMVSAQALTVRKGLRVAQQAALDVVRYDQHGCYSPHLFYVQKGGAIDPQAFAQHLAHALASLQHKLPRRALSLEEAAHIKTWRETQVVASLQDPTQHVSGGEAALHTVVFSERCIPLAPGPLNRCVTVVAVDTLDEVMPMLTPQRDYLQTVGLAAAPEELLQLGERLGQAGVTRICALGAMTSPEAGWHHDGRFSLLDLVRMVDIEASTELQAQQFAPYEV